MDKRALFMDLKLRHGHTGICINECGCNDLLSVHCLSNSQFTNTPFSPQCRITLYLIDNESYPLWAHLCYTYSNYNVVYHNRAMLRDIYICLLTWHAVSYNQNLS